MTKDQEQWSCGSVYSWTTNLQICGKSPQIHRFAENCTPAKPMPSGRAGAHFWFWLGKQKMRFVAGGNFPQICRFVEQNFDDSTNLQNFDDSTNQWICGTQSQIHRFVGRNHKSTDLWNHHQHCPASLTDTQSPFPPTHNNNNSHRLGCYLLYGFKSSIRPMGMLSHVGWPESRLTQEGMQYVTHKGEFLMSGRP